MQIEPNSCLVCVVKVLPVLDQADRVHGSLAVLLLLRVLDLLRNSVTLCSPPPRKEVCPPQISFSPRPPFLFTGDFSPTGAVVPTGCKFVKRSHRDQEYYAKVRTIFALI